MWTEISHGERPVHSTRLSGLAYLLPLAPKASVLCHQAGEFVQTRNCVVQSVWAWVANNPVDNFSPRGLLLDGRAFLARPAAVCVQSCGGSPSKIGTASLENQTPGIGLTPSSGEVVRADVGGGGAVHSHRLRVSFLPTTAPPALKERGTSSNNLARANTRILFLEALVLSIR